MMLGEMAKKCIYKCNYDKINYYHKFKVLPEKTLTNICQ